MLAINNYYTNIPGEIIGDSKINFGAKLLFGKIQSLSHKEGFCWSRNKYLAKLMGVSARTIQRWIETLKKNNYIKSEIIYKEGSKEVACRKLSLNSMSSGYDGNVVGSHDTAVVEELINNNTNKDYYIKKERNARACENNELNKKEQELKNEIERLKKQLEELKPQVSNETKTDQDLKSIDKPIQQLKEEYQNCTHNQTYQDFEPVDQSNLPLKEECSNRSQTQAVQDLEHDDNTGIESEYSDIFDFELKNKYSCEEIKKTQQDNYTESVKNDSMSTYGRESFDDITSRKISYTEERVKLGKYLAFIICRFGKITNDVWEAFLDRYLSLGNTVKERLANLAYSLAGGYRNIFKAPKHENTQTQYSAISIFD